MTSGPRPSLSSDPARKILDHDICHRDHLKQPVAIQWHLEIEDEAGIAPVCACETSGATSHAGVRPGSGFIPMSGGLHFQDLRAHVCKTLGAPRTRQNTAEIDDANARQSALGGLSFVTFTEFVGHLIVALACAIVSGNWAAPVTAIISSLNFIDLLLPSECSAGPIARRSAKGAKDAALWSRRPRRRRS